MEYKKLSEYIENLEDVEGNIQDLYLLKFGCVTFSKNGDQEETRNQEIKENIIPEEAVTATAEALKKHHHVFNLQKEEIEHQWNTGSNEHTFINGNILNLRIEQPERFKRYNSFPSNKPIEKFNVITKGSPFIAYAPVPDIDQVSHFAHEYREIFTNQINEETEYTSNILGPCPIHPDTYLAFIKKPEKGLQEKSKDDNKVHEEEKRSVRLFPLGEDLLIVVDSTTQLEKIITETLEIINYDLIEFYRLMSIRSQLLSYNEKLNYLFEAISSKIVQKLETPWYYFRKLHNLTNDARKALYEAYIKIVEYENILIFHKRYRDKYQIDIKDNIILSNFSEYLLEHSQHDADLPDSFKSSISHFEKDIHLFNNLRTIILASLSGAVIGSLLTFALSAL